MSNFLREGDKVYMTHNMGVKGVVTEVFINQLQQTLVQELYQNRCG